jgi:broad specificity phosphatase PhoE
VGSLQPLVKILGAIGSNPGNDPNAVRPQTHTEGRLRASTAQYAHECPAVSKDQVVQDEIEREKIRHGLYHTLSFLPFQPGCRKMKTIILWGGLSVMRLYYIRHGQSENNLLWDQTGSDLGRNEDPALTEKGMAQAKTLAQFIQARDAAQRDLPLKNKEFAFTHVYSSLMQRAAATGYETAKATNLPLVGWRDLHEWGGIYLNDREGGQPVGLPGKPRSFFERKFAGMVVPEDVGENGWWNRPYEGEEERIQRARNVLSKLIERHGGSEDRVAFFSHGGFFNVLMRELLGMDAQINGAWFMMYNTAITCIEFKGEEIDIVYTNRVDFLTPDLIT